jgi:hypothetical protein
MGLARPKVAIGDCIMSKSTKQNVAKKNGGGKARITKAQAVNAAANEKAVGEKAVDPDLVPITQLDKEKKTAKPKAAKQPKEPKAPKADKRLSCLDAAVAVLKEGKAPMACKAMIDAMHSAKLWTSDAPTPHATLYSAILREITTKGSASRFKKTERGQFALNA